ncbi:MAG: hypothetical protein ACFE8G_07290 [Candidatus Hermodarchaeota archaeon]
MNEHMKEPIVINWLAHHNSERSDFKSHVFVLFNYALCIGCFAFLLGVIVSLIIANLFYFYLVAFISFPVALTMFLICWVPSIFQYSIQIMAKKSLNNRAVKFLIRFLYPVGSIIFIFISPLWGFLLAIPAGYAIIRIRKVKNRIISKSNQNL